MKPTMRWAIALLLVLSVLGIGASDLPAQGNVEGMTYTSPTFGYQLQWSSPWYFITESVQSDGDYLLLSDSISTVTFRFEFNPMEDAQTRLMWLIFLLTADPTSYFRPLQDSNGDNLGGGDADHAWAGYSVWPRLEDGSTTQTVFYLDVRILPDDVALVMFAITDGALFDDEVLQGWQDLASTALIIPPDLTPPVRPTVPALPTSEATPFLGSGPGEPAPVFVAGPWRVAVRTIDQGGTLDHLGLHAVEGQRWVVVYADMTNWSSTDATLETAGMTLITASGPVGPDQEATQSTASSQGLEPADGASVPVAAGRSIRLALVYSIPAPETTLLLDLQGMQLPIDEAVGRPLDVTDLSSIVTPPSMQSGRMLMTGYDSSGTIDISVSTETDDLLTARVLGVASPMDAACFADVLQLSPHDIRRGDEVWFETDSTVPEGDAAYVWYEDEDGNRVLLNQWLVAQGIAIVEDLPEDARFAAWLRQTEAIARAEGVGLWSTCAEEL